MAKRPKSGGHRTPFWSSRTHRERLRAFLSSVLIDPETLLMSPETACQVAQERFRIADPISSRSLRNFISGDAKNPHDHQSLGLVFQVLAPLAKDRSAGGTFADGLDLFAAYEASGEMKVPRSQAEAGVIAAMSAFVADGLAITPSAFAELERRLFDSRFTKSVGERVERYYLCYRYHSTPGRVVKSHLAIKGRDPRFPGVLRFTNHLLYRAGETAHKARGILLPMKRSTYLIGDVDSGDGLTQVAVPSINGDNSISGLFLSLTTNGQLACGRILLVPTNISHTQDGRFGVLTFDEAEAELGEEVAKLANYIPFELTHPIFHKDSERPVGQPLMVSEVATRLVDERGDPLFTYEDGTPFNPADTRDYTFNAALKAWDDAEPSPRGPRQRGDVSGGS